MLFQKALQKALRFRHSFHFLSYKYNQIQWLLSGLSLASAQLELWFTARTIEMSLDSSPLPLKVCPWSDGTVPRPTRATATGSQLALHFLLTCLMANSAQIRLENNRPHWPNDFQWFSMSSFCRRQTTLYDSNTYSPPTTCSDCAVLVIGPSKKATL